MSFAGNGWRPPRDSLTVQARAMLDEAVGYVARDSPAAAQRLLIDALDAASSLATLSERGRRVPEVDRPNTRERFVQRYRLIYEVDPTEVHILAFLHGARDFENWRRETRGGREAGYGGAAGGGPKRAGS